MIIFYDELSGTHNITEEWVVTSLSMVLVSDSGKPISEHHVKNPFIWGGPSIIYTTISNFQGTSEYFDWHEPIKEEVSKLFESAMEYLEQNESDSDITIVTWSGYDYMPDSLSEFKKEKLADKLDLSNISLKEVCSRKGIKLNTLDSDERVKAIMQLYYSSIKRLD